MILVGQIEQLQESFFASRIECRDFGEVLRRVIAGGQDSADDFAHAETGVDQTIANDGHADDQTQRGENGPRPTQPLNGNAGCIFLIEAQDHQQSGGERNEINPRRVDDPWRESGPNIQRDEHERHRRQRDTHTDGERVEHGATEAQPIESAARGHAEQRDQQQQPHRSQSAEDGHGPAIVAGMLAGEIPEQTLQRKQEDERGECDAHVADGLDEG